jgi:hypothetical protein
MGEFDHCGDGPLYGYSKSPLNPYGLEQGTASVSRQSCLVPLRQRAETNRCAVFSCNNDHRYPERQDYCIYGAHLNHAKSNN